MAFGGGISVMPRGNRASTWETLVNLSANAAALRRARLDERMGKREVIEVTDAERRGMDITAKLDGALGQMGAAENELPPGTRVKLATTRIVDVWRDLLGLTDDALEGIQSSLAGAELAMKKLALAQGIQLPEQREHKRTRTGSAEVLSVGPVEGGQLAAQVRLRLLERGGLFTDTPEGDRIEILRPTQKHHQLFIQLLQRIQQGGASEPLKRLLSGSFERPDDPERFDQAELTGQFDDAQREAFELAMAYEECPNLFIQGPPGTGKTTVLSTIVEGHVAAGRKVLVLSETNDAIDVVGKMLQDRRGLKAK